MTSRGAEKMKNDTIGVDVSKDHLDAHRLGACPRMVVVESEVGCLLVVGMEFSLTVRRRRA